MTAEVRELVRERAPHRCEYCGSPSGRATVALLQMNAPRRLERRAELVRRGKF